MSDDPRSAVLVGYGRWGRILYGEVNRGDLFRIDAIVSPTIHERHEEIPGCNRYRNLEEALDDGQFEVAFVAVPPQHSARLVEMALNHELDVFAEKPVAQTISEATHLCIAAHRKSRVLYVDYTYRFHWAIEDLNAEAYRRNLIIDFGLVIADKNAVCGPKEVLWLWGPHLCAIFHDVFKVAGESSSSALEDATLQVIKTGPNVRLDLSSVFGQTAYLEYDLDAASKKRELVVTQTSGHSTFNLLQSPPSKGDSALSKSIALFAHKTRNRILDGAASDSCDVACIQVTELLERASKGL